MNPLYKIIACFLILTMPAIADTISPDGYDTWELYVLGGASTFRDLFFAISSYTSSSGFRTLTAFVALLGFLILMIQNTTQLDHKKLGAYFMGIWVASYFTFYSKVDISIIDSVGANIYDQVHVVTDVPASVGLPAAWTSSIGEYFADGIGQYFSSASSDFSYSNTKHLNFEAQIMKDMMEGHPFDADLTRSLAHFYTDCLFPIVANSFVTMNTLMNSNDIFTEFTPFLNPAITTVDYTDNGNLKNCEEAAQSYDSKITTQVNTFLGMEYVSEEQDQSSQTIGFATNSFANMATAVLSTVDPSGNPTASGLVKNRAVAKAFDAGMRQSGTSLGLDKDSMATYILEEQGKEQQTQGWRVAIEIFNSMVTYIFVTLHAFIIGIAPLIMVMIFIPGVAGKIILSYLQILFWLCLWAPMMTIVNYIITSIQENALTTLYSNASVPSGTNVAAPIFWAETTTAIDKYQLAAGFLGTMVPMISWGLVKSGMAFSQFISSGIGTSVAQGVAKNVSTGTLSMDNSSFSNTSGNKFDTTMTQSTGFGQNSYLASMGNPSSIIQHDGVTSYQEGQSVKTIDMQAAKSKMIQASLKSGETVTEGIANAETEILNRGWQEEKRLAHAYQNSVANGGKVGEGTEYNKLTAHRQRMDESVTGSNKEAYQNQKRRDMAMNSTALLMNSAVVPGNDKYFKAVSENSVKDARAALDDAFKPGSDARKQLDARLGDPKDGGITYDEWANDAASIANMTPDPDAGTGETARQALLQGVTAGGKDLLKGIGTVGKQLPGAGTAASAFVNGLSEALPEYKLKGSESNIFSSSSEVANAGSHANTLDGAKSMSEKVAVARERLSSLQKTWGVADGESTGSGHSKAIQSTLNRAHQLTQTYDVTASSSLGIISSFSDKKHMNKDEYRHLLKDIGMANDSLMKLDSLADGIKVSELNPEAASAFPKKIPLQAGDTTKSNLKVPEMGSMNPGEIKGKSESAGVRINKATNENEDKHKTLEEQFESNGLADKLAEGGVEVILGADKMAEDYNLAMGKRNSDLDAVKNSQSIQSSESPFAMGELNQFSELDATKQSVLALEQNGAAYRDTLLSEAGDGTKLYAPVADSMKFEAGGYTHVMNEYSKGDIGNVQVDAIYSDRDGGLFRLNEDKEGGAFYERINDGGSVSQSGINYTSVGKTGDGQEVYKSQDLTDSAVYQKTQNADGSSGPLAPIQLANNSFSESDELNGVVQKNVIGKDQLSYEFNATEGYYQLDENICVPSTNHIGYNKVGMNEQQQEIVSDYKGELFVENGLKNLEPFNSSPPPTVASSMKGAPDDTTGEVISDIRRMININNDASWIKHTLGTITQ